MKKARFQVSDQEGTGKRQRVFIIAFQFTWNGNVNDETGEGLATQQQEKLRSHYCRAEISKCYALLLLGKTVFITVPLIR